MAENYPLVEQREYGRPDKRVGWPTRRPVRDDNDIPRIAPHQVRVYRVGDDYIEDPGMLRPDDPVVTRAGSVTVVDRRIEVPVGVETRIPSREAGEFTVRITFYCTVTDACAVVRDGVTDLEALLLGHLRDVPGLTEDGHDLPIDGSATVRDRIDARLTAYHEMRPAPLSGLRVRCGLVEVRTPAEHAEDVARLERERHQAERDRLREEMQQEADLRRSVLEAELELRREKLRNAGALHKERFRQDEELEKEHGRQTFESLRARFTRESESDSQRHDLTLRAERNRFNRDELTSDFTLIGNDPLLADFNAWRQGDITADELSNRLREAENRRDELEDRRGRTRFEDELKKRSLDREEAHWRIERKDRRKELDRQARRDAAAARQHEDDRRFDLELEDRRHRRQEEREDAQLLREERREQRRENLAAWTALSKQAFDRGLFDGQLTDPSAHINRIQDITYDQVRPTAPDPDAAGRPIPGAAPRSIPHQLHETDGRAGRDGTDGDPGRSLDPDEHPDQDDWDLGGTDAEANLGH
ncbi:hypothetical protein G3I20_34095 [Streptomyces sp. SID8111]|uniref:hypothetical protein n=1 Tax=Streptomyces sp. SID8111 TaxID=2706100 RepID=UPI0013C1ACEE|nr:hypothetical protein [Streptomyces sp. SID8111]NEC31502.1 hypothetical protein [Streptomyces sp. SID8111]